MTIKLSEPNIFDQFLNFLGKKRGVFIPTKAYEDYGQYVYAVAKKENYWKALLRPADKPLPEGSMDIFECGNLTNDPKDNSQNNEIKK